MAKQHAPESVIPSDKALATGIAEVLRGCDLTKMSLKVVRSELERRFKLDTGALDTYREKLKRLVAAEITLIQEREEAEKLAHNAEAAAAQAEADRGTRVPPTDASRRVPTDDRLSVGQKRQREEDALEDNAERKDGRVKNRQQDLMTVEDFNRAAKTFSVRIGEKDLMVEPKRFSSGSCGFFGVGRAVIMLDGQPVVMQCNVNCAVIGSKGWKES